MSTDLVKAISDIALASPHITSVMQDSLDDYLKNRGTTKHVSTSKFRTTKKGTTTSSAKNTFSINIEKAKDARRISVKSGEQEQNFQNTLNDAYRKLSKEEFIFVTLKLVEGSYKAYYLALNHHLQKQIKLVQRFIHFILGLVLVGTVCLFEGGVFFLSNKHIMLASTAFVFGVTCEIICIILFLGYRMAANKLDKTRNEMDDIMRLNAVMHYTDSINDVNKKRMATETLIRKIADEAVIDFNYHHNH